MDVDGLESGEHHRHGGATSGCACLSNGRSCWILGGYDSLDLGLASHDERDGGGDDGRHGGGGDGDGGHGGGRGGAGASAGGGGGHDGDHQHREDAPDDLKAALVPGSMTASMTESMAARTLLWR